MMNQGREKRKNELLIKRHREALQLTEEGRSLHDRTEMLRNSCRKLKAHCEVMRQFKR